MSNILVAGLINIETTLRVDGFPIEYNPVRYPFHGVDSAVSGVGYNVAKALTLLGNDIRFCAMVGKDAARTLVFQALETDCIPTEYVLDSLAKTPQSVILYDGDGRRQINVDLKDIQQRAYPEERFAAALQDASVAVLCNVNFSRRFLHTAKRIGKPVATDVHTISNLEDDYNRDYMAAADILFMSDERLPCGPEEWTRRIINRYGTEVVVIGLGAAGALMSVKSHHFMERIPAVITRPVVNTIGAGDALFSAFVHIYSRTRNPYDAIRKAMVYASYKVGATGAAEGLMNEEQLETLYSQMQR
jgi:sugar/nucleoside kinase (ribokinase family)